MSEEAPIEEVLPAGKKSYPAWLPFVIDFGPLLAFFGTYWLRHRDGGLATVAAIEATMVFMVAALIALIVSKWKLGKISPMLWFSSSLILVMGALTIYFHSEEFIKHKPTIVYAVLGTFLIIGWMRGKAPLKILLQSAFDELSEEGWKILSRNWGFFFLFSGFLNEVIILWSTDFGVWVTIKAIGGMALSFLFAISQVPVMMRHGLATETQ